MPVRKKGYTMIAAYKVVLTLSALFFLTSICLGWIGFPILFKRLIKSKISLVPKTPTRELWQSFPFPFEFGIHVFNVTNPLEVQNGGKPIVQDVGPFVFDEFKDKYGFEDNEKEDTVSFNMRNTFIFRPDKSNGLTGEELITMPHPLIQTIGISVKRQNPDVINIIAEGLKIVFKNAGPFITAPFMDLFFRGISVDCSYEHYAAKAVCGLFDSGSVKGSRKLNDTHFLFSLMGKSNHTDAGRLMVLRGQRNSYDLGKLLEVNGKRMQDVWFGAECNNLKGTDGTVFPPFFDPNFGLWSYSPDLCRSIAPKYSRNVHYAGIPAARFIMDFGDIKNEPENHCFCRSYPYVCPVKGTMDLSPCTKTPMIASMPHFLHGDESLVRKIDGLYPTYSKHGTQIDFDIISGTPLSVYKRIQFNLDVEPVAEISGMENMEALVMPMFWIDENLNLMPTVTDGLKKMFKMIHLDTIFKWSTLVASIILFAAGIYLFNKYKMQYPIGTVN